MNLGIVTIAYNNYGRFILPWCESITKLTQPPQAVTVVLGKNHGLRRTHRDRCLELIPSLKIVTCKYAYPTMGKLRNIAVKHTETEWIQYLSVDDVILPDAIEEYEKVEAEADFISIRWESLALWAPDEPVREHKARLPEEMAHEQKGRGFVVNHSPFRRSFWERSPYMEHDYPNAPFVAGLVELGARFKGTEKPCTRYMRRLDSHCGRNLGRRRLNGRRIVVASEKNQARHWKKDAEERIRKYYLGE